MTSGQRIAQVAGVSNLRDFGGYATSDGATIPWGRLYRSAHLGRLNRESASELSALHIHTIIDLRGREERLAALPTLEEGSLQIVSTPIEPGALKSMILPDGSAVTPELMREHIVSTYRRFAGGAAPAFGKAMLAVLDAADRPLLIHCTAGKDRTGFVVALIQSMLGVPWGAVVEDYLLTNAHWDRVYEGSARFAPEVMAQALMAHETYLEAAFRLIEATHGSVEKFAEASTGVPDFAAQLRKKLASV